jgi:hypothetical protein
MIVGSAIISLLCLIAGFTRHLIVAYVCYAALLCSLEFMFVPVVSAVASATDNRYRGLILFLNMFIALGLEGLFNCVTNSIFSFSPGTKFLSFAAIMAFVIIQLLGFRAFSPLPQIRPDIESQSAGASALAENQMVSSTISADSTPRGSSPGRK